MIKLAIACIALSAGSLFAQCNTIELEAPYPTRSTIMDRSEIEWIDPDGPNGPIEPFLVHTAPDYPLSSIDIMFKKGPYGWQGVPGHAVDGTRYLLSIKEGAAGLTIGHVVMYGKFWSYNNQSNVGNAMRFDGTTAYPLGNTTFSVSNHMFYSMVEWDLDGDGPGAPVILASGTFTSIGGVAAPYMATYDGQQWAPFQHAFPQPSSLQVLDPDGPGPMRPTLFATGCFVAGCTSGRTHTLSPTGEWIDLGIGYGHGRLTYHDEDGPGPIEPALYHAGFNASMPGYLAMSKRIGDLWVPVPVECARDAQGGCLHLYSSVFTSFDADGPGPLLPELILAGTFERTFGDPYYPQVATFAVIRNGQLVIPIANPTDQSRNSPSESLTGIAFLKPIDPDGSGPRGTELLLGGGFANKFWTWNGREILSMDRALEWSIRHLFVHDPDGPGPEPRYIYGAGQIQSTAHELADRLVRWENGRWRGLTSQTPSDSWLSNAIPFIAMTTHDFDGPGPQHPRLVGFGNFYIEPPIAWNDQTWTWEFVGPNFRLWRDFRPYSMVSFDEDASGPLPPVLFCAGECGIPSSTIIRYDGGQWVDSSDIPNSYVCRSLVSHDPDGAGPGLAMLIASTNGGLWRWTGTGWINFAGVNEIYNGNTVHDMRSVDLDGPGPRPIELVVGTTDLRVGTTNLLGVHAYDGTSWRNIGGTIAAGVTGVRRLFMFDPDGPDGPAPEQLAMTCFPRGVYRLQNNAWIELNTSFGAMFRTAMPHTPGVEGPGPGELFLGGEYTPPNSNGTRSFAHYKYLDLALIVQSPIATRASSGQEVSLSIDATGEELRYQWHRGTSPIQNGPGGASVGGGTVSGAQGPVLTITGINCSDVGEYRCIVSNGCSTATSAAAAVTLRDCCTPDYNGDGSADTSDIFDLAHDVASGTNTYPPNSTDFNNDGAADTSDILDLANVIAGAECP